MHKNTRSLLKSAAHFRSLGLTWNEIGKRLHRQGKSCQQWTLRYPELWRELYPTDRHSPISSTREHSNRKCSDGERSDFFSADKNGAKTPSKPSKPSKPNRKDAFKSVTKPSPESSLFGIGFKMAFALFLSIWLIGIRSLKTVQKTIFNAVFPVFRPVGAGSTRESEAEASNAGTTSSPPTYLAIGIDDPPWQLMKESALDSRGEPR